MLSKPAQAVGPAGSYHFLKSKFSLCAENVTILTQIRVTIKNEKKRRVFWPKWLLRRPKEKACKGGCLWKSVSYPAATAQRPQAAAAPRPAGRRQGSGLPQAKQGPGIQGRRAGQAPRRHPAGRPPRSAARARRGTARRVFMRRRRPARRNLAAEMRHACVQDAAGADVLCAWPRLLCACLP